MFVIAPLGSAANTVLSDGFGKCDNIFLKLINGNFISIMHYFRYNVVLLQTETDAMVLYSLGVLFTQFVMTDSERVIKVYAHALLTDFAYLKPLKSYSAFPFWLGFPHCRRNLWGFRGK